MINCYINNLNISQKYEKEVTKIIEWIETIHRELWVNRRKKYKYIGMDLNLPVPGEIKMTMFNHHKNLPTVFIDNIRGPPENLVVDHLFSGHTY